MSTSRDEILSVASIAVLDVGKTNVRLVAVDECGRAAKTLTRPNTVLPAPPYPHFDSDALFAWVLEGLGELANEFPIESIVPVTHGACAALVAGSELVLPILDYEYDGPEHDYDADARRFSETYSPRLPLGLNLGRQLAWLEREYPQAFAKADHLLLYPGYWAWRLCGALSYEVTSLGCHTDLWSPEGDAPSALAQMRKWDRLLPHRAEPWKRVGAISEEVALATGLDSNCGVLAGIHDSNASYLAHRAHRDEPFCVVSTGTWIIALAHGGSLGGLLEERDTLANVDAFGDPTPTARFMGGREYAAIAGREGLEVEPCEQDLSDVLDSGVLAVPSFSEMGGPFPERIGAIVGLEPKSPTQWAALASLYCALVTDVCLELLAARGEIVVDGRFARNRLYCRALAALREDQPLSRSLDETGTLAGAARLARMPNLGGSPVTERLTPLLQGEICAHRARWRARLEF
jgi:sugar (pentulose or hexulose) kinase